MRTITIARLRTTAVLIAVLVVGFLRASPVSAQCTSTATSGDLTVRGNPKYQGGTTQMYCSGRTVEVGVWIDGNLPDYGCSDDDCTDTSTTGSASQQVWGKRPSMLEAMARKCRLWL